MENPLLDMQDARERLEAWRARVEERGAETRAAAEGLQALRVTATDDNEVVEATIDHSGTLIDVRASARVLRQPPEYTAAAMLQAYQNAKRKLAEAAAEVVQETIGTDSATGKAMLAGFKTDLSEER